MAVAGNGNWQRLALIGASIPVVAFFGTVLWQSFSVANSVQQQASKNIEFERRLAAAEEKNSTQSAEIAAINRDLNEVETQFCEEDHLRNLMHAEELRRYAVVYEKIFGQPYPLTNSYYPIVCNRHRDK